MNLEQALGQYHGEMLAKFQKRASKYPNDSVTSNNVLAVCSRESLERHLREERLEVDEALLLQDEAQIAGECIDEGNMAFLRWWWAKESLEREKRRHPFNLNGEMCGTRHKSEPLHWSQKHCVQCGHNETADCHQEVPRV